MKVSVCIVTRNRSTSLRRTVLSVLSSDYDNYEILVIDNSDESEYKINSQTCSLDKKIRQIKAKARIGIAALRQIGFLECVGEVLAYMDDDIEIPINWMSALVVEFNNNLHLGIYGCNVENIGFEEKIIGYETHGFPKKHGINGAFKPTDNPKDVVTFGEINLTLRREFMKKVGGFDSRFKWGYEGADLTIRMLACGCELQYNQNMTIRHYFNDYRSRSKINLSEYYRLLFFFKNFNVKRFSIVYELKRIYYFAIKGNLMDGLINSLILFSVPLIFLEAKVKQG